MLSDYCQPVHCDAILNVINDSKYEPLIPLIFLSDCNNTLPRCYDANLVEIPVEVETPDHHYYHVSYS